MAPFTKRQLVELLVPKPRGKIVLWNMVDGYQDLLLSKEDISEFLAWWAAAFSIIEATPSPLNHRDPLFDTLDLLRLEPSLWLQLAKAYPGLASLGNKPDFRLLCPRRTHRKGNNGTLLTTLPTQDFFSFIAADVKNELLGTGTLDTRSDGVTVRALVAGAPLRARADRLKAGTHLGRPGGVLWYTTSDSVNEWANKPDADGICNILGLAHLDQQIDLLALEFDAIVLRADNIGRPTPIDAGSHCRFKTRSDVPAHRHRSSWGRAADLSKCAAGSKIVDGAPERIARPIPTDAFSDIRVRALGRTLSERPGTKPTDDEKFADRVARGRDETDLKTALRPFL